MPFRRVLLSAIFLLAIAAEAPAAIVYSNNFETNAAGFSAGGMTVLPTDGSSFASPTATSTFLGQFSADATTLTVGGLVTGQTYTLEFDLFIGRTWDGNDIFVGPDGWQLTTLGTSAATLINSTFSNLVTGEINDPSQNYSDSNLIGPGSNPAFTGADVARTDADEPGAPAYFNRYAIYYLSHGANPSLSFSATSTTATFTFAGSANLQGTSDEFWALDNVRLLGPDTAAVPEPASLAIWSLATLGCAVGAYRRRKRAA